MIPPFIVYLFGEFIFSTFADDLSEVRFNPLLSAQCKARCLYQYRSDQFSSRTRSIPSNDEHFKRSMVNTGPSLPWRSSWERCPRLSSCSSCLLPCDLEPLLLLSTDETCQAICSTLKIDECQGSCQFIGDLYRRERNCLTSDCRSCSASDDCSENIARVYNLSISERKSRRTVKLKWNSITINPEEPVFYVIEAQWTLSTTNQSEKAMLSKWGFVKEEVSHNKAIIRNIQRDQRWYFFRIAAVTRHGSSPYVRTSKAFRLSHPSEKSLALIEAPRNVSIVDVRHNSKTINVTLSWSKSESPVDLYQITWQSDGDQSSDMETVELSSLELTIPHLSFDKSYLFKVRSMIITEGNEKQMSSPQEIHFRPDEQIYSMKNLQLSAAYFSNGLIKANLSWTINDDDSIKQYDLSWIESQCHSDVFSCCYRRDAVTIRNLFQLYDLRFNCTYLIKVRPIRYDSMMNKTFQIYLNVSSCSSIQVQGSIVPSCDQDRKTIDIFSSLPPMNLLVTRNQSGWNFFWQTIHSSMDRLRYRLNIEQWPDARLLLSQNISTMSNRYFFPQHSSSNSVFLNVTLTLLQGNETRQEQRILIDQRKENLFEFYSSSVGERLRSMSLIVIVVHVFRIGR